MTKMKERKTMVPVIVFEIHTQGKRYREGRTVIKMEDQSKRRCSKNVSKNNTLNMEHNVEMSEGIVDLP